MPPFRAALAALCLTTLTACVPPGSTPFPPVPPPMAEEMPKPPVSTEPLRWRPGYWDWTGTGYAWTGGEYISMAGTTDRWMPGWWTNESGSGWVWRRPGWVR